MTARPDPLAALAGREVIIEATQVGDITRVCAVDAETGLEVVVMTPAHTLMRDAEQLAARKLARRISASTTPVARKPATPHTGRGRLV